MTEPLRLAMTLGVFILTLGLVLVRPKGWNEAWWTVLGGALMLALRLETPQQAWEATRAGQDVLLFLLALLLFSALLERSGFFEWAAIRAAQMAGGEGHRLYRNVFLLGALITALLSLDTTAVILTPVVLAFVTRLSLPARPYIFTCAFVANTASLLLPVSNLTNLLFAARFHLTFGSFAAHMLLPQVMALLVNYALFRILFRRDLPPRFAVDVLPAPESVIPHPSFFRAAVVILILVLIGYFLAPFVPLKPYAVGFGGCLLLGGWGLRTRQVKPGVLRDIAWPLFPFVIGLFVVVRGVENLGLAAAAAGWLEQAGHHRLPDVLLAAGGTGLAANIVNNIPAALLAISVLREAHAADASIYGAILGADIGANVTLFGSLATMLVLTTARRRGMEFKGADFLKIGIFVTPLILLAASLALWLIIPRAG